MSRSSELSEREQAAFDALLRNAHKRAGATLTSNGGDFYYPLKELFEWKAERTVPRLFPVVDLDELGWERYGGTKRALPPHWQPDVAPIYVYDPWAWELCVLALTPRRTFGGLTGRWHLDKDDMPIHAKDRVEIIRQVHLMRGKKRTEAIDALLGYLQMLGPECNALTEARAWWRTVYGVFK